MQNRAALYIAFPRVATVKQHHIPRGWLEKVKAAAQNAVKGNRLFPVVLDSDASGNDILFGKYSICETDAEPGYQIAEPNLQGFGFQIGNGRRQSGKLWFALKNAVILKTQIECAASVRMCNRKAAFAVIAAAVHRIFQRQCVKGKRAVVARVGRIAGETTVALLHEVRKVCVVHPGTVV